MDVPDDAVEIRTREGWREWLQRNHGRSGGVWLVRPRKGGLSHGEAVEEALCFGWIDSLPRALDEGRTMLRMAPRKPGSNWSRLNKERVERLIAAGRMEKAGLRKVEAAKADSSWNALDEVEETIVPPDLAAELEALPPAKAQFEGFPRSVRRGILEWILNAKRSETRAARIRQTAESAQRGERANQWRNRE